MGTGKECSKSGICPHPFSTRFVGKNQTKKYINTKNYNWLKNLFLFPEFSMVITKNSLK
jgi:hypothetical protein